MKIRSAFGLAAAAGLAMSSAAFGQCASCPAGGIPEGEPPLNNPDNYNGGCNSVPFAYGTISNGQTICGTCFTVENQLRDTDWFHFTVNATSAVSWTVTANFDAQCFILNDDCNNIVLLGQAAGPACSPITATATLAPGQYAVFVSPQGFAGIPTDQPWVGTLSSGPAGACCLPGGCCQQMSSAACTAAGGTYQGAGSACGSCPGGPVYTMVTNIPGTFTDISGTGADITNGDDSSVAFTSSVTNSLVASPNLFASTNGDITDASFATYVNAALPAVGPTLGLFPFWDDLYVDPALGGTLRHQNTGGAEVIQWNNVRTYAAGGPPTGIFEVKIFPNGTGPGGALVQYIYQDVAFSGTGSDFGGSATIGWQNGQACTNFGQFSFNQPNAVANGTVISILGAANTGACCLPGFTCTQQTQAGCVAAGGVFQGVNSQCTSCPQPPTFTFATNVPGTFQDISASGTDITSGDDSSVAFSSGATNDLITTAALFACTNGMITTPALATFTNGTLPVPGVNQGLFPHWDDMYVDPAVGGSLKHQVVNGVEIVQWTNTSLFGLDHTITGTWQVKIFPQNALGPSGARAQFIYQNVSYPGTGHENGISATVGYQQSASLANTFEMNQGGLNNGMVISILPVAPPNTCYPNCDHSTTVPFLNVLDFNCFLNRFGSGDSYANCDNSTTPPVLNVLDFNCFLNRFSLGCSAP